MVHLAYEDSCVLYGLIEALRVEDQKGHIQRVALDGIRRILHLNRKCSNKAAELGVKVPQQCEDLLFEFENLGGLDALENLQLHPSHEIFK